MRLYSRLALFLLCSSAFIKPNHHHRRRSWSSLIDNDAIIINWKPNYTMRHRPIGTGANNGVDYLWNRIPGVSQSSQAKSSSTLQYIRARRYLPLIGTNLYQTMRTIVEPKNVCHRTIYDDQYHQNLFMHIPFKRHHFIRHFKLYNRQSSCHSTKPFSSWNHHSVKLYKIITLTCLILVHFISPINCLNDLGKLHHNSFFWFDNLFIFTLFLML